MAGILDNPVGNAPVLQVNPMAGGTGILGQGSIGMPKEGQVIPPSSPNVALAIRRATGWMQERALREPQPALLQNIQIMMRGGPLAEAVANHTLKTFQPHPSEALPPPTLDATSE